jgi:hypothetical protein
MSLSGVNSKELNRQIQQFELALSNYCGMMGRQRNKKHSDAQWLLKGLNLTFVVGAQYKNHHEQHRHQSQRANYFNRFRTGM